MAGRRARRSRTAAGTAAPGQAPAPREANLFFPDEETTPAGKNRRLAELLTGTSAGELAIVLVKRLEIGASGWLITYRS